MMISNDYTADSGCDSIIIQLVMIHTIIIQYDTIQ